MRSGGAGGGLGGPFVSRGEAWPPIPRLWPGADCVLIAGGPSLTLEDVETIRRWRERGGGRRVLVVNNAWQIAPWADCLYACDWGWWNKYRPTFAGLRVSQDAHAVELIPDVKRAPSVDEPGLSLDPLRIHTGLNGGHQALNLAVLLGAARVILVGYDMQLGANGEKHWHGNHPEGLNNPDEFRFREWIERYALTLPDLAKAGVEVVNATRRTALDCFPRIALEATLR